MFLANGTIARLKQNLSATQLNGGIQLGNPFLEDYFVAYSFQPSTQTIYSQLQNSSQAATVNFSASASASGSYDVSFSGSAGFNCGTLLDVSVGTSFKGDIAKVSGAGSSFSISVTYPGLTVITPTPVAFQEKTVGSTGWLDEVVLYQANKNFTAQGPIQTGFTFSGAPRIKLGENGTGYLSAVAISNYPTILVNCSQGNYSAFSSWLQTHSQMNVSLFGFIPVCSSSVDTFTASAQQNTSSSGFTLKLTPPAPGVVAPLDQVVPVLGGQVTWFAANAS